MNNPGMDLEIWKNLRKKWADLESSDHKVSVEFQLLSDPNVKNNIFAIDVVQKIDDGVVVETVQRNAGEAYTALGIDRLSAEQLEETYVDIASSLHEQGATLTVTMSPTSSTSGELRGVLEKYDPDVKSSIPVNYHHYYILNALREKMTQQLGKSCSKVTAVYRGENVEFSFDY
jgi:hypothetical protein